MTIIARPNAGALLALAASLALGACASIPGLNDDVAPETRLATEQFPISVEDRQQEMLLAAHADGLSPNQRAALSELAADWRDRGGGPIQIQTPAGDAGRRIGEAARLALISSGAPDSQISITPYTADRPEAPVRVAFRQRVAAIPDCSAQWGNLTSTGDNLPHANFGCAVSANMAAMIADPSDLLGARPMDPADAGRRQTVLDKYRKGEITGAQRPEQDGYISNAVK